MKMKLLSFFKHILSHSIILLCPILKSILIFLGGWASASCPHMVVYCIKFVLRGESPRDYVDLLRSLAFPSSINISDMPQRLAAHANHTIQHFFRPDDGRLFSPSETNINAAKEGSLIRHLPWVKGATLPKALRFGSELNGDDVHPVTGVSDRYSLCDRFHERNSSCPTDLLRRVTLVPELNAIINTEVEEQLHNSINRSNYSFNMMLPGNHLFMMRLKIHTSNVRINDVYRIKLEKAIRVHTGPNRSLQYDSDGILLLRKKEGGEENTVPETVMSGTTTEAQASMQSAGSSNKSDQPSTSSFDGTQKVQSIIQGH